MKKLFNLSLKDLKQYQDKYNQYLHYSIWVCFILKAL
jgi:hypothetical protein